MLSTEPVLLIVEASVLGMGLSAAQSGFSMWEVHSCTETLCPLPDIISTPAQDSLQLSRCKGVPICINRLSDPSSDQALSDPLTVPQSMPA